MGHSELGMPLLFCALCHALDSEFNLIGSNRMEEITSIMFSKNMRCLVALPELVVLFSLRTGECCTY